MYKAIAAGVAAVFGLGLSAQAADLGDGSFKDAPVAYGPGHSWAGLYLGGSVGIGAGDVTDNIEVRYIGDFGDEFLDTASSSHDVTGGIYGAHVGYNWQFDRAVLGFEAGINGTDMDGSKDAALGCCNAVHTELNWYATAVARLGYAHGSWLLYGFGGVAWGNVDTALIGDNGERGDGSSDHLGWTAGLGVEYAFNDRFSVRAEYSHVDLGEETATLYSDPEDSIKDDVNLKFDAIKIGVNYKLFGDDRDIEPLK